MPVVYIRKPEAKDPPGSQVFNSNGTFVVPAGYTQVVICMCGGGGAGGGDNESHNRGGGGGGSGVIKRIVNVTSGEIISVTIAPRMNPSASSNSAASSTFAAASGTITAIGGVSGNTSNNNPGAGVNGGGAGGTGLGSGNSGGCPNLPDNYGEDNLNAVCDASLNYFGGRGSCLSERAGHQPGGSIFFIPAGGGGAGGFGNGGWGKLGNTIGPGAGNNTGAGGAAGGVHTSGYSGGSGKCIVYWGGTHPPSPVPT